MVKIMSFYEYRELRGRFPESMGTQFKYCASRLPLLLTNRGHYTKIDSILRVIEDTYLYNNQPVNKFIPDDVISFSELSDGCKTALLCYYMSVSTIDTCYVNITECGPLALTECLKIVDDTNVVGVLGAQLNISCDFTDFDLEVDGKYASNWLAAVAAACKHLED